MLGIFPLLLGPASWAAAQPDNPWRRVATPTQTQPESIGSYSKGCLKGAISIEITGAGFQLMRLSRRRYYGHPLLADYIRRLGRSASAQNLGTMLIGDLAQPRGGPSLSGHASHQTGLDADIWFFQIPAGKILGQKQRENLSARSLVIGDFEGLSRHWNPKHVEVLKLAASDAAVDRVFVNPVIKKAACDARPGEDWLAKLRPWWGHDNHFHVRLKCAPKDSSCETQEPLPPGNGCDGALDDWFTPETKAKAKYQREHPAPPVMPILPDACQSVLREQAD